MVASPTRTAALSSRSRTPSQVWQGVLARYCEYQRFIPSDRVFLNRLINRFSNPSYRDMLVPWLPQLILYRFSPVPKRMVFCCFFVSFRQGLSKGIFRYLNICRWNTAPMDFLSSSIIPIGFSAPCFKVRSLSGMTRSGSKATCVPRPLHSWHIPWGLLNENDCGINTGNEMPQ